MEFTSNHYPGAQLPGGEGLVLPAVSLKIEKSALILGKCTLFVCNYGLRSH